MSHRRRQDRARHNPWPRRPRAESASRVRRRTALEMIEADESIIVVNKPPGIAIEPGMNAYPSVIEQVVQSGAAEGADPLAPLYPLDTNLSGIVLLARSEAAFAELSRQRADGQLIVHCLVLVAGSPQTASGSIDGAMVAHIGKGMRTAYVGFQGGPAVTDWNVRDTFIGFTLLECTTRPPVPGQIQVHLASVGMPLAVDFEHGGGAELMLSSFKSGYHRSRRHEERPLIARPTLHVAQVQINHPTSGLATTHCAPLPKDFRAAVNQLDRYGRIP